MARRRFVPMTCLLAFALACAADLVTADETSRAAPPASDESSSLQPVHPSGTAPVGPLTRTDIEALQARGRAEGWTFEVGHNSATDRSLDDLCGLTIPPDWEPPKVRDVLPAPRADQPTAFDWRILRGTVPVRDQGACGSCWSFSAIAPVESAIMIKEGIEVDLAEQWPMACTSCGSCNGGWHECTLDEFLCTEQGAVLEEDFPYEAYDVACNSPYDHPYCIDDYTYVGSDDLEDVPYLKQAILDSGPISILIAADSVFQAYLGGVFNAWSSTSLTHAVALVGWDDNQGANGVWILRNSWGPDWGEYGYMRIEYGCNLVGYASYSVRYEPSDCNHNGVDDGLDMSYCAGTGEAWCDDCNSNALLDTCERDCNENGVPDDCDITSGFSLDTNGNFLPDECETDCNENGQFDFYELQDNLDADIDRNLVPDECQDCDDDGIWDWDDAGRPGGLLVVSNGKDLVRGFYPDVGSAVGSFGAGHLTDPDDVVVGPDQHVYVSSSGDNRVVELDPLGNYIGDLNPCGTYPTGLAFGPDDLLYIASRSTNSVFRYDTTSDTCLGECIAPGANGLWFPYGLGFSEGGNLFVVSYSNHQVLEYEKVGPAWQFVRSYANAQLYQPHGLTFHPSGDLLVASSGNAQIIRFDEQTGAYMGVFGAVSPGPGAVHDIAYGANGYLYVATYGGGVVRIYELNGLTGRSWRTFNRADPDLVDPAGLTFYPTSPYDCNNNYIPDTCESMADCDGNSIADLCEIENNDCNGNSVLDACELAGNDCNGSGLLDECEVPPIDPGAPDCNANGIPDECDSDTNDDGIPDDCACMPTSAPDAEEPVFTKGRYLSFKPTNVGSQTALRVTVTDVPDTFSALEGEHLWLGPPLEICENSGQSTPPIEGCGPAPGLEHDTMLVSRLQCQPYFTDWGALELVHIYHEAIIPSATYVFQTLDEGCDQGLEQSYSAPLSVPTAAWGDCVGDCTTGHYSPPDGAVNVTTDCTAILDKFKNLPLAPIKAVCDIHPGVPDQLIGIADLTYCIEAFIGLGYPFEPDTTPCGQ